MSLRTSLSTLCRRLSLRHPSSRLPSSAAFSSESAPAQEEKTPEKKSSSFASLLRQSSWIQMGDPKGKVVVGEVYHVIEDDLYIDIGHKFPCVCRKPRNNSENFRRGVKVRVLIKSLELSQKFLGYENEMTLMEADGVLLGLYSKSSS
ncbi:small ribosomal subunit protein bS1m [Lepeophtheirus salmonis]|uniref:28S ribosomal protein S28, mitochondrial n=1 Tax=Lepeophtheirus salmonis TaxID=72036 RepID=D3PIY3_LEPSM|nr:28S ribosomal protein S28, mitochondrial-like [Lepeophtheirus salmonis]ADD38519.1 28S ribosomal protein S28, mitochondrial [Lepeophtheirus salmonis]